MKLFGKKVKSQNKVYVIVVGLLGVVWRILMGDSLEITIRDSYVFPVIGFFLFAVISGELTRRLFRFFIKSRNRRNTVRKDDKEDKEALGFAIGWSLIWVLMTVVSIYS